MRIALFISLLLTFHAAYAQTQRSGDNGARAIQQLQALTAERAQLKTENDKLKADLDAIKKQLAAATSGQQALQQRVKAAEATAARDTAGTQQTADALERTRSQMQELVTKFRETAQTLKEVETDRSSARRELQSREREYAQCVDRNKQLISMNGEILDRLERRGFWSSFSSNEPFTKIQRTRLDNLIDEYRDKAVSQKIEVGAK